MVTLTEGSFDGVECGARVLHVLLKGAIELVAWFVAARVRNDCDDVQLIRGEWQGEYS